MYDNHHRVPLVIGTSVEDSLQFNICTADNHWDNMLYLLDGI